MILIGPVVAVILGLMRQPARIAYGATVVACALGGAALGYSSWHDSKQLPVGYWLAVVVSFVVSFALCYGARAVRARRAAGPA